jgi:hypothetical protein
MILVQPATPLPTDRPLYGVVLRDFELDGNFDTIPGADIDGILFRSNRGYIEHVQSTSVPGTASDCSVTKRPGLANLTVEDVELLRTGPI